LRVAFWVADCAHTLPPGATREGEELRGVAAARHDVEHLHAGAHLREPQQLHGMAPRIHAAIALRSHRVRDDCDIGIGGNGLDARAGRAGGEQQQ
jgi:hypothetical protein